MTMPATPATPASSQTLTARSASSRAPAPWAASPTPGAGVRASPAAPAPTASPLKPSAPRVPPAAPMSRATARRRLLWNGAALLVLWYGVSYSQHAADWYYDALDLLMTFDGVPVGADEMVDAALLWLRYALTLVLVLNVVEAGLALQAPAKRDVPASAAPMSVGEAFMRQVSPSSSPRASDVRPRAVAQPRQPSYQRSAATPAPGASARSPSATGATASPFRASVGLGRPSSSPFLMRSTSPWSASPAPRAVTPSASLSRSASPSPMRASYLRGASPSTDLGTWRANAVDAMEVERALQQLAQ